MAQADTDRNLLLGILAYQNAFVSRDALFAAMQAWLYDKARPLAEILQSHGALDADRRQLLEALVAEHLKQHSGDAQQSLQAVSSVGSVRDELAKLPDADLQVSVLHLSQARDDADPNRTPPYLAGTSTSAGTRFRRLRPHAKGGLGEVFVALDTELNREVALKEIQSRHADQPESRARFLLEAEVTGGLEHPGVVPVYGLGSYADGRPFYAMRFVRGSSLMDAIQSFHHPKPRSASANPTGSMGNLQLHKLLRRFVDVCNALQYAHDRGVLHRDLKPGNVMLGKYGETLVVDWGLSKPVGRRLAAAADEAPGASTLAHEVPLRPAAADSAETVAGSAIGTPAYMSPEQAAGRLDLVGPASDVYSLGATLYSLLTGRPPVQGEKAEVLKKVREGDFLPPRQINPGIARALNAICLKAMARRPEDRYAAPKHLADEVEHWLADEPVRAWPEPLAVRIGRWVRRHKPLVSGAAAALFVGLVALTAGLLWYQREQNRLAHEEALREAKADRKRAQAEEEIRNALAQVEQARGELDAILKQPGGVFGLVNNPTRWKLHIDAARASLARARALQSNADSGVDSQLAARADELDDQLRHDEGDRALAVKLEKVRMDRSAWVEGKFDIARAAEEYPKAWAEAGFTVLQDAPAVAAERLRVSPIKEQLLAVLDDWAWVADRLGQADLSEHLLHLGRLAAPDPAWGDRIRQIKVWRDQHELTKLVKEAPAAGLPPPLLGLIGTLLRADNPEKETWHRQAREQYPADFWLNFDLANALQKSKPVEAVGFYLVALIVRPESSAAYNNLANTLIDLKRLPEAIAAYKTAIAIDPKHAIAHNNLGLALRDDKQLTEAVAALEKATAINPEFAHAYYNLGNLLRDHQKKLPEAIAAFNKAIDIERNHAFAYNGLGIALRQEKRQPEALAAFEKAIAIAPKLPASYYNRGTVYYDQRKLPEAIAAFNKAIELDPQFALAYFNLGMVLREQKQWPQAIAALKKAVAISPTADAYSDLGACLREQKQLTGAVDACEQAIAIDPNHLYAHVNLGNAYLDLKKFPEAIAAYNKAIDIQPKFFGGHFNLANAFREHKQLPEAIAAFKKALEIDPNFARAHGGLGYVLFLHGDFTEAAGANDKALSLLPANDPLRPLYLNRRKECQQMLALEKRVPLVLEGKEPAEPGELLKMALMCQLYQRRHAAAVQLYQQAFKAHPALTEDGDQQHRYNAACAAALAGVGKGEDATTLRDEEKEKLRQQARAWLQADLDAYAKNSKGGKAPAVVQTFERLSHWQADSDLAGVREFEELRQLPEEEAKVWQRLWADLAGVLKEARSHSTEARMDGELTETEKSKAYPWNLVAGRTYVLLLKSKAFVAFLNLEGPDGKPLVQNKGTVPGVNARIVFSAPADGVYRIVATSLEQAGVGPYTLSIREFTGGK
jgi:tetratricopeptide (TPR) repeat protein/serine/threonine protein kinase